MKNKHLSDYQKNIEIEQSQNIKQNDSVNY